MSETKKHENVRLNIVVEDPSTGRIQTFNVEGINYVEPQDEVILIQGEDESKRKVHVTFSKR